MPQSLSSVFIHAVFSTKLRQPLLADPALRAEMHAYIGGVSSRLGCPPVAIGGVEDHAHVLVCLSRTTSISEWIKEEKRVSTNFVKPRKTDFAWQGGYGVFSTDIESLDRVAAYVRNQEEHHRKFSFQDEFRRLDDRAWNRMGRALRVGLT
ncbi:MAG: transposase [Fimbriimonadales bacterium]